MHISVHDGGNVDYTSLKYNWFTVDFNIYNFEILRIPYHILKLFLVYLKLFLQSDFV